MTKVEGNRRRSAHSQLEAMRRLWPDFTGEKKETGLIIWRGPLMPKAQSYSISIFWHPAHFTLPYVVVSDPPIRPRTGGTYEQIPHLIFNGQNPELSALCLFDPDGNEWSEADLIAEKTVYWAAEWLTYYELWHLTGEWLAPSAGYESVAHIMAAEAKAFREATKDVH